MECAVLPEQCQKQRVWEMSLEDISEILEGKRFEEHKRMISELSLGQQWNLIKYFCDLLCKKQRCANEEDCSRISNQLNHLIAMVEAVDTKGILCQILYQEINKKIFFLVVVSLVRTEKYLELNERFLGVIDSIK